MPTSSPDSLTHRRVLAIAVPIMLSNVTQPLIGVVDTAVLGQLPEAYYIGGIAVGALIFSFLYWGFGFLRMGTSGLTAQAFGAGDQAEVRAVFGRAVLIALAAAFLLIALAPILSTTSPHRGTVNIASSSTALPMRVMMRMFTTTYGLSEISTPICEIGPPTGPIENGITYIVRPRIAPANKPRRVARILSGSSQLFVGPASSWRREQMKVRSSTRATSLASERAR